MTNRDKAFECVPNSLPQDVRLEIVNAIEEALNDAKTEMRQKAADLAEKENEGYTKGDDEYMLPVHIANVIRKISIEE